jgi:hypothetical protein
MIVNLLRMVSRDNLPTYCFVLLGDVVADNQPQLLKINWRELQISHLLETLFLLHFIAELLVSLSDKDILLDLYRDLFAKSLS